VKIYYSNFGSVDFEPGDLEGGLLVSFAALSKKKAFERPGWVDSLMLDSGAFSVFRKGEKIDLGDYIAYCLEHGSTFDVIVSLDVIGRRNDPISELASYRNYRRMRLAGVPALPVFHPATSSFDRLHKYARQTNYVGIGGIARIGKRDRIPLLNRIFEAYPNPEEVGFHGFGVNDEDLLTRYPWKSVDAASVHQQARFGGIYTPWGWLKIQPKTVGESRNALFDGMKIGVARSDRRWRDKEEAERTVIDYIRSLGYDTEKAQQADREGIRERCLISIARFEAIAKTAPERYEPRTESIFT
jgi:hypothetical protein